MKTTATIKGLCLAVILLAQHPSVVRAVTYSITPNPATVSEGAGSLTYTINRSGGTPAETIYASTLQTEGFSNNSDYTGILNQSVTFTSGQASKTVNIAILNDTIVEANEKFAVIVQRNSSDPNTTYLAKSTFTITDNDTASTTYSTTPAAATVSEGAGSVSFTINRTGGTPAETIYASTLQTEGFSNSGDYTGILNQSVTFTSGQTSKTLNIAIQNDTIVEANEKFAVIVQRNASDPNTTYLAKSTFTITDNDTAPTTYTTTPAAATVGEGAGSVSFTINRTGGTPAETLYWSTLQTEGYVNNGDYNGVVNQTVTFSSGQASKTVSITILDDSTVEANEIFAFIVQRNASDPNTTYLAKSTFTITDNDTVPTTYTTAPAAATVGEGAGSVSFTINRTGGTPAETLYWSTLQTEGYVNNGDYNGVVNQTVTFSSGQASKTVSINILDDSIFEANETFAFIIQRNSSDPNTTYLAKSTFTITDNDDLVSTYTITPNPATVSEGAGTLTFAINRFGGMPEEIIYGSSLQTEGYVNGGDYTGILNQPITFASGQASKTVVVAIVDDSTVEAKEKFAFIIQRNASDPNTTYLAKSTFFITDNDANNQCDLRFDGTPTTSPTIVAPGNSILVNYRRLNGEQALAGVSQTKILVVNAAGQVIATSTFSEGTLAAGSVESLSRSITIPPTTAPGSYFVVVNLDHQGILLQTSTANDQSDAIPFAVASSPATETRADLAANGYPLINKTSVFPGESIDVATVFDNVGFGPSPSVEVVLELLDVANNVIESSQIVAPGLAAGSSSGTLNITMVIPTTVLPGPYSIRFVIQGAKINQISYANDYSPSARLFITSTTPPPSEELIEGVDVSRHQGTINWQAVKAAGKHFAYIKASENNQPMHIAYFNANYSNAKQAGLAVGAYHFANPLLAAPFRDNAWSEPERSAKTEAGWFVTIAQPVLGPGHLPPALDIEAHAVSYTQNVSGAWFVDKSFIDPSFGELASDGLLDPLVRMGAEALANWIIDWCSEVERLSGIKPIVYMTKSYSTQLAPYLKDRYSLWIAALSDDSGQPDVTSWGSWFVHQYDWYGTVAGISGNADLNVLRGPISDRVIQSGNLASRGRLEVKGNTILVEVTGGDSQKVTIQGSTSLQGAWQDITTIQLNNGFGEVTTSVDALQQFLRIKPD